MFNRWAFSLLPGCERVAFALQVSVGFPLRFLQALPTVNPYRINSPLIPDSGGVTPYQTYCKILHDSSGVALIRSPIQKGTLP